MSNTTTISGNNNMVNKIQPFEHLVTHVTNNPNKGQTILHKDVENLIGIPYRKPCGCLNNKYSYEVSKARRKLLPLGLTLEPISGVGYRILPDNQFVDVMRKKFNIGLKYIHSAKQYADNTDISALSLNDYNEWSAVNIQIIDACKYLSSITSQATP